jgi:Uncharacterized protein conserved in bacteria
MMKNLRVMAVVLAGLYASVAGAAGVMVENPWVREAPPTAAALGAFMVLHNQTAKSLVLVGAHSAVAAEVQLHRTVVEGGMAKMLHQHNIEIPANGKLEFKPGDYHLMLMQPARVLKAGEKVEITLKFKDGSSLPATFEVRAGMGMAMDHGKMMHHGH